MNDVLISMFIDDEMDLDEKCKFVKMICSDNRFAEETMDLLEQEKLLQADVVNVAPAVVFPETKQFRSWFGMRKPVYLSAVICSAIIVVFLLLTNIITENQGPVLEHIPYRFVIHRPGVKKAEIIGSFTNWQAVPMNPADDYWQITLDLPAGEHRFAYILDGRQQISDPTIPIREKDDFGGENSILEVQWSV